MITSQDVQQNIPKAVQWVTQIEQACMEIGHQLSTQSKRDARTIGVRQIDLVRVMVLDETPLPTDRDLRKFILQTAICSNKGIAFGHGIVLKTGAYYRRLIAHKLAHVMQYERFGGIEPFLVGYIPESFPPHYPNGPLEREAEQLAKTVCCYDRPNAAS
jgi:hypothetical protein